jgi:hypothetical protein
MSADAIQLVSLAIQAHLKTALIRAGLANGEVYVGALDDEDAATASLVLFLYRLAPNASLRNEEHRVPASRSDLPAVIYPSSLPLDLYYLLTVGPRSQASEPESLRLLGFAMQALQEIPNLVGTAVLGETVRLTIEPVTSEEMSRIWALFPTQNYRTSVVYLASPIWVDPPTEPDLGSVVLQQVLRVGQRTLQGPI